MTCVNYSENNASFGGQYCPSAFSCAKNFTACEAANYGVNDGAALIVAVPLFVVILACVLISAVVANGIIVAALFPIVALVIIARVIIGLRVIVSRNGNCFNSSPRTAEAPRG